MRARDVIPSAIAKATGSKLMGDLIMDVDKEGRPKFYPDDPSWDDEAVLEQMHRLKIYKDEIKSLTEEHSKPKKAETNSSAKSSGDVSLSRSEFQSLIKGHYGSIKSDTNEGAFIMLVYDNLSFAYGSALYDCRKTYGIDGQSRCNGSLSLVSMLNYHMSLVEAIALNLFSKRRGLNQSEIDILGWLGGVIYSEGTIINKVQEEKNKARSSRERFYDPRSGTYTEGYLNKDEALMRARRSINKPTNFAFNDKVGTQNNPDFEDAEEEAEKIRNLMVEVRAERDCESDSEALSYAQARRIAQKAVERTSSMSPMTLQAKDKMQKSIEDLENREGAWEPKCGPVAERRARGEKWYPV